MKIQSQYIIVLAVLAATSVLGQSHQQWAATFNGYGELNDIAYAICADNAGNVISAGITDFYSAGDGLVIKYNSSGETQWTRTFEGSAGGYDIVNAVTADDSGNIYITGNVDQTGSLWDLVTIKYDTDGNQVWMKTVNGNTNYYDGGTVITTDDSGNCFVGGYIDNPFSAQDYLLLKYDPSGNEIWRRVYSGPGNGNDVVLSMTLDDSLNIYITGRSVGTEQSDDFTTIKYDSAGGLKWIARYNDSTVNWGETPRSVTVDKNGNVYVSGWGADGYAMGDMLTIKYAPNGIQQWVRRHHGPSAGGEGAYSVETDDQGNVYVAGSVSGPYWGLNEYDADYTTVKYNSSGDELWAAYYNGPATELNWDWILAMRLSPTGDVIVTGWSGGDTTGLDIVTIAYDSAGNQQWLERYDGGSGSDDQAYAMALDPEGNIYVGGFAIPGPSSYSDMVTIKYSPQITGIIDDQKVKQGEITLYPNPCRDITIISFNSPETGDLDISLYNLTGNLLQKVYEGPITEGKCTFPVDLSQYQKGIYPVIIKTTSGMYTLKISKIQ